MLGAAGVLVGTRFYATTEALSAPQAREKVVAATGDATCRTSVYDIVHDHRWPDGHTNSVLANTFTDRWHGAEPELHTHRDSTAAQYRQAVAERDYTLVSVTTGQAAGLINSITPASEIVTTMAHHAAATLAHHVSHLKP